MKALILNLLRKLNEILEDSILILDYDLNLSINNSHNQEFDTIILVSSEPPNNKYIYKLNIYNKDILNISVLSSNVIVGPYFINNKNFFDDYLNKLNNMNNLTERYTTTEELELVLLNLIFLLIRSPVNKDFIFLINYKISPIDIKKIKII